MLKDYLPDNVRVFSTEEVMGWKISSIKTGYQGISFSMRNGKSTMKITSGLLGRHQVAPVAYVAAIAHNLGLSKKQIEDGCQKTMPFQHRMQQK